MKIVPFLEVTLLPLEMVKLLQSGAESHPESWKVEFG